MSYKKILIISQMFLFNSMFSEEKARNNEILGKEISVNPTDVELQRISQEVNEINKNFEIIKLKQEKNVKNNTYKDFLTANSELEKLRISLEKSNVKKNISKKERLKNIQEQKELAEELSVKIQILTLKIDIMYKEKELSNLEYFQKRNKNVKKMDRIRVKNCN